MKKIVLAVVVLSLLIAFPAFAAETQKNEMPGMSMDKAKEMPMAGMGKKGCSMMGQPQIVAATDGGVIVLAGPKLMKYDADLNLVKEVELKKPQGPMGGKQCPLTGKMLGQDADLAGAESQEKTA